MEAMNAPEKRSRRRSDVLGLTFPYDWSNPDIQDDALIRNVIERGLFADVCVVCAHYGLVTVKGVVSDMSLDAITRITTQRMFSNIAVGFARV